MLVKTRHQRLLCQSLEKNSLFRDMVAYAKAFCVLKCLSLNIIFAHSGLLFYLFMHNPG